MEVENVTAFLTTSALILLLAAGAALGQMSIECDETINGSLTPEDPRLSDGSYFDFYSFVGQLGLELVISMSSSELDTFLIVMGEDGTELAEDDDGGEGTNSWISMTFPQTATYFIAASSLLPEETGVYMLSIECSGGYPIISDIPDQAIKAGEAFAEIFLDEYVSDPDSEDREITWTYSGNSELTISINHDRIATITAPDGEWSGSETISFTASDPDGSSAGDNAVLTVYPIPILPGDVNKDGSIGSNDVILLLQIAVGLLEPTDYQIRAADMNGDGKVGPDDAIFILRKSAGLAAPGARIVANTGGETTISLSESHAAADGSVAVSLREFTSWATPTGHSALLQNFPNPFNPETWIPYRVKEESEVAIRIYGPGGELVRELDLGHRPAGLYTSRGRAAYWDGKNEACEQVSSGIYFYTIQAGEFAATKKMVVAR